jgi:hypothetical protein
VGPLQWISKFISAHQHLTPYVVPFLTATLAYIVATAVERRKVRLAGPAELQKVSAAARVDCYNDALKMFRKADEKLRQSSFIQVASHWTKDEKVAAEYERAFRMSRPENAIEAAAEILNGIAAVPDNAAAQITKEAANALKADKSALDEKLSTQRALLGAPFVKDLRAYVDFHSVLTGRRILGLPSGLTLEPKSVNKFVKRCRSVKKPLDRHIPRERRVKDHWDPK